MHDNLACAAEGPTLIEPNGKMRVPVRMFVNPQIMPGANAIDELLELARIAELRHPIAAMPDVHYKGRNPAPTGIVMAMRNHIVPFAVDKGINCGMRMVNTGLPASACNDKMLDALYGEIQKRIPIKASPTNLLSKNEAKQALTEGSRWAQRRFGLADSELDQIERRGCMFEGQDLDPDEIVQALPRTALKKARRGLGSLGAGNHFLEAQEIVEILDPEKASFLGLTKGNIVFMLHTGSGAVASQVMRYYSTHALPDEMGERMKITWEKLRFHLARSKNTPADLAMIWKYLFAHRRFFTIAAESTEGRQFIQAIYAASNFGYVNRMAITEALREAVRTTFADPEIKMPLLFDCSHVTIQKETHAGEELWIHRHGANVALPPSRCSEHPVFRHTGQPIPVPGSMGADSFISVGVEGNASTYHSANHGAGRVLDKPEASQRWSEAHIEEEMRARRVRLYRGGTMDIAEQAPGSFKDIGQVIEVMRQLSIAEPVVRLRPRATLKG